jgi:multicomponent Na+:H+ antiporter subunit G
MTDDLTRALLAAGVFVVVTSALSMLAFKRVLDRLHLITPITSLGAPLIGLAIAIDNGWGLTTAQVLLIVFFMALAGPVLEAATGRMSAQREGVIESEAPQ